MTTPFEYPATVHIHRHGPSGYADYESYRPWLRDEFAFRCVYCLRREAWGPRRAQYHIDHFAPVAHSPELTTTYDNLRYACSTCNSKKRDQLLPDPLVTLLSGAVAVDENGQVTGQTPEAKRLILLLELDGDEETTYRWLMIESIRLAEEFNQDLHRQLLGFPADLPDLSGLRPPGGNTRSEGVGESHAARRERAELPATY